MNTHETALVEKILDRANDLIKQKSLADSKGNNQVRDHVRGDDESPFLNKLSQAATATNLSDLSTQLTQIRDWVLASPELLSILDQAIHAEFQYLSRKNARVNIFLNAMFTVVGAVLGLVLPLVISLMSTLFRR